jgi:MATE family multidrug resistance protein
VFYCSFVAFFMAAIIPHNNLQVGTSYRQILKIAMPISLALLVPQVNFVANTIFLGGLGELELGAAGITGVYYLVFALVGNGLNSGLQALIARRAGENRRSDIGLLFSQSIWIALLFAAFSILLCYIAAPYFFGAVIENEAIRKDAIEFSLIRILGLPFLYLFQMCNAMLVGTNNSKYLKYAFFVEAVLNIFLDYALIYGKFGFSAIGFNGAAIASVCAEIAGFALVLGLIHYKKFSKQFSLFSYLKFRPQTAGLIFKQSSPLVMQFVLSVGAWLLFYLLIEKHGPRPLAISNAIRNMFGVFGIFIWAFANTSNAMVSNIIGQGKKEQVLFIINKIARLSFGFTLVMCILINLFPQIVLSIYGQGPEFIAEATPVLRIVSIGLLMMSVGTIWLNGVTGTANTRINLAIEIITIFLYSLYIYLVLHVYHLSLPWAWASELLYWSLLFVLSYWYLQSGKWKNKVI